MKKVFASSVWQLGAAGLLLGLAVLVVRPELLPGSPTVRILLAGGALVAAALAIVGMRMRHRRDVTYLRDFANCVCRTDVSGAAAQTPPPPPDVSEPVATACRQVQAGLDLHLQRLDDVRRIRAAADVRTGRLSRRVDQLSAVVDRLTQPVLVIDSYDELVVANPAARKRFQLREDPEDGEDLRQRLKCPALVDLLIDTRRRKTVSPRTVEIVIEGADGETTKYRVLSAQWSESSEGDAATSVGAFAVLEDVSEEDAIYKRNAEFVSSVSHEMKTPLSSIKAYTEMLGDEDVRDPQLREEFLETISSQADRLQRLVDNLLNLARIEAGVVEVSKTPMALNDLLEEACSVVQPRAEEKKITLDRDLSPMYLGALVDRDMLLQATINLLSNAVKYTPEGGQVTLRSRLQDEHVLVEVEDNGVGLSEEDCLRVFDKFYRVKKQSRMASGTGLGLPLAKHIVEDVHSGRLTLTSEVGKGSTFRIQLPQHAAAASTAN